VAAKKQKPSRVSVSIVGAGNLGTALALTLPAAGYDVKHIAVQPRSANRRLSASLARKVKARLVATGREALESDIVWITVPDDKIGEVAKQLAEAQPWKGSIVFHSSGALTSEELAPLRKKGAKVASVHPMMTFVRSSVPQMTGVAFALEGDAAAVGAARVLVQRLGGNSFPIKKRDKALYHAFGSFASPLVVALMASLEEVAHAAGIRKRDIKPIMLPLLSQTVNNYLRHDAAAAFSGPIVRGDVATVRRHLSELERLPEARAVYVALARAARKMLPGKNKAEMQRELDK
jgi:predicted short-subunit dehydrogenase-like oxidoreductase (DUF2520 family)